MQRDTVAVMLCLLLSALSYWLFVHGQEGPAATLFNLGGAWFCIANWLGGRPILALHMSPRQLYQSAKGRGWKLSGIAQWIDRGSMVLMFTGAVTGVSTGLQFIRNLGT